MPEKKNEDEWFKKHEILMITTAKRERERKEKETREKEGATEARRLRELHWMCCPKCGNKMEEAGQHSMKVDRCTVCEGIFLDRGELEDILLAEVETRKGWLRGLASYVTGGKVKR